MPQELLAGAGGNPPQMELAPETLSSFIKGFDNRTIFQNSISWILRTPEVYETHLDTPFLHMSGYMCYIFINPSSFWL